MQLTHIRVLTTNLKKMINVDLRILNLLLVFELFVRPLNFKNMS